jgi:cyclase
MIEGSKRLIGVLTIRDGILVKSYGYNSWRPSVSLSSALRTLDRWQLDEIVILDISRKNELDHSLIDVISKEVIFTPLTFGGGIRREKDLEYLSKSGCDRFVVESAIFETPKIVQGMVSIVGRQALIGSLPIQIKNGEASIWNQNNLGKSLALSDFVTEWIDSSMVSEVLISAVNHEGTAGAFPQELPTLLSTIPDGSAIWFGGIDKHIAKSLLNLKATSAVAFGNILHEKEIVAYEIRNSLRQELKTGVIRQTRIL